MYTKQAPKLGKQILNWDADSKITINVRLLEYVLTKPPVP